MVSVSNINLITNPSFETNTTGWSATGATFTRDNSIAVPGIGTYCAKLVASGGAAIVLTTSLTGLTVGANYTVSFYVKIAPVVASGTFSVIPVVGTNVSPSTSIDPVDSFRRRIFGFTATATTMSLNIQTDTTRSSGDTVWIDNVMLTQGGLTPYFDGSFPTCTWSGTAHASTSTCGFLATGLAETVTTDEVVLINNFCLNSMAWNITTKTGRYTVPGTRGDDFTVPGANGATFVANKPFDSGTYSLSMYVLGMHPDGSTPTAYDQRSVLADNLNRILRQCVTTYAPVTLVSWQPDGSLLTSQASLFGSTNPLDATGNMGGRRLEFTLVFDVISSVWQDYAPTPIVGTPSATWSSQTLALTQLAGSTAPIDDAVITVTGPISNPIVSNTATGTSISLAGTVPAGQSWVIDCGLFTSKVNGVSVLSTTTHVGHSRFVLIAPGNVYAPIPTLSLQGTATSSATNLSVTARRKFLLG